MNDPSAIARAVLYEGFALYPYRNNSLKNRRRILFGTLWPEGWGEADAFGEPCQASTQVLLRTRERTPRIGMTVRYLRLDEPPREESFESTSFLIEQVAEDVFRVRATVRNTSPIEARAPREEAEDHAMGAAHVVLRTDAGEWISAIDPPPELTTLASTCVQGGLFPVLLGPKGASHTMLAAPIILYDHPEIAPESAGDLFDATEIEEILSLRLLTLSDAEKEAIRRDPQRRALLDRIESLGPHAYAKLHGVFRDGPLNAGTRVRLHPRSRADAFDVLLGGMEATVQSIEHTVDGRELVCVTIDRDPGRDLGEQGLPGHRFYFQRDEMEVLR